MMHIVDIADNANHHGTVVDMYTAVGPIDWSSQLAPRRRFGIGRHRWYALNVAVKNVNYKQPVTEEIAVCQRCELKPQAENARRHGTQCSYIGRLEGVEIENLQNNTIFSMGMAQHMLQRWRVRMTTTLR